MQGWSGMSGRNQQGQQHLKIVSFARVVQGDTLDSVGLDRTGDPWLVQYFRFCRPGTPASYRRASLVQDPPSLPQSRNTA